MQYKDTKPKGKKRYFLKSQTKLNDFKIMLPTGETSINELIPTTKGNDLRESSRKA